MKARLALVVAAALAAAACSSQKSSPVEAAAGAAPPVLAPVDATAIRDAALRTRFANVPDRGSLVRYPDARTVREDGAYTWHRADFSESHARAAIGGVLAFTTPAGELLRFRYERHVEHPNGDWTWVGSVGTGSLQEAVITFGAKAAFGSIGQTGKEALRLTMRNGASWLVETDLRKIAELDHVGTRPKKPDFLVAPEVATSAVPRVATSTDVPRAAGGAMAKTAATTTVDLVLGYTNGFASAMGGVSAAATRLNNLVEITNETYANSQIDARVRLVRTVQVNYRDDTANDTALHDLTGFRNGSSIPVPVELQPLRAARDQYGADLVSLVRDFRAPENDGCGIAWLLGGGRRGSISASSERFGYSIVSDGDDANETDGKNYFCRQETLAHELGHNMGAAHDRDTSDGEDNVLQDNEYGVFDYSFGHKTTAGEGNFYTVMAYGDSGQVRNRIFSTPLISKCGAESNTSSRGLGPSTPTGTLACGTASADNARTLAQTMPVIASFRATVVPIASSPRPDVVAIAKLGGSGRTEVHAMSAASSYGAFAQNIAAALQQTGSDYRWQFQFADYNGDGTKDLYVIFREGASNTTEVHILNGANGYQSFLLNTATALHRTGSANDWIFRVADYNGDGTSDLYAIARNGGSGRTEIHVLNGANQFQGFLANIATVLFATGSDSAWDFALGDYNRDSRPDVYVVYKLGASNTTEVHVMNGANAFQGYLVNTATALHRTPSSNQWNFRVGDYDGDGVMDVYCINKVGGSNRSEVHVLNGASGFSSFAANIATVLHSTGSDNAWAFELR